VTAALAAAVDRAIASTPGFAGVVRVDRGGEVLLERSHGLADRAHGVPVAADTRFGIASGSKAFTALVVLHLVETGALHLATTARSLLGPDLPLVAADVTVEHLLAHRSGIGDYLDEGAAGDVVADHLLPVPVHELATTEGFLAVLDGFPTRFPAGERFAYCNGGYVVLALLAERASGRSYHDLVQEVVLDPAGMASTAYLRSDELPGDVARGYLGPDGLRTNVLHLPVRGTGDGGAHTTAADLRRFWQALLGGRIVSPDTVAAMVARRSEAATPGWGYGLGVWLPPGGGVAIEGMDAGASCRSVHHPDRDLTHTVLANEADAAWPVTKALAEHLAT
jgi:CubicO group peptidase (beta-lactamase class C family)